MSQKVTTLAIEQMTEIKNQLLASTSQVDDSLEPSNLKFLLDSNVAQWRIPQWFMHNGSPPQQRHIRSMRSFGYESDIISGLQKCAHPSDAENTKLRLVELYKFISSHPYEMTSSDSPGCLAFDNVCDNFGLKRLSQRLMAGYVQTTSSMAATRQQPSRSYLQPLPGKGAGMSPNTQTALDASATPSQITAVPSTTFPTDRSLPENEPYGGSMLSGKNVIRDETVKPSKKRSTIRTISSKSRRRR